VGVAADLQAAARWVSPLASRRCRAVGGCRGFSREKKLAALSERGPRTTTRDMDRWQAARQTFDEHFSPLREAGYRLERVTDRDRYFADHEAALGSHFPKEYFFDLWGLRSEHELAGQARLAQLRGGETLRDFTFVYQGDTLVAAFCGQQNTDSLYRMGHSNVHRDFRRRGIYRMILQGTLGYTAALGFDTVTSEHSPANNAILIAKLRAGFHIYALELDPRVGPSVVLRYFHNPEHRAAFELRCGNASLTSGLRGSAFGAWGLFERQVRGETAT
jgi:ribosomal protein S18 acetylase RimI-like enzyme